VGHDSAGNEQDEKEGRREMSGHERDECKLRVLKAEGGAYVNELHRRNVADACYFAGGSETIAEFWKRATEWDRWDEAISFMLPSFGGLSMRAVSLLPEGQIIKIMKRNAVYQFVQRTKAIENTGWVHPDASVDAHAYDALTKTAAAAKDTVSGEYNKLREHLDSEIEEAARALYYRMKYQGYF
jgi:hypothetical protein